LSFQNSEVFFKAGSAELTPYYQNLLGEFFPKYIKTLIPFQSEIRSIRIEGHTSSEWRSLASPEEAYLHNMRLAHERTRQVLEYCLLLPEVSSYRPWLRQVLTAHGLSSSQVVTVHSQEDSTASRRVEFSLQLR